MIAARAGAAALLAAALSGCVSFAPRSPADAGAMQASFGIVMTRAAYTQVTEHYAVTNDHTAFMVNGDVIRSPRYDLAFFRHDGTPPRWADAKLGEPVTVTGNPVSTVDMVISLAVGAVTLWPDRETEASMVKADRIYSDSRLTTPIEVIIYEGPCKPGYSGGPVVDASGAVIAVTSGVIIGVPKGEYRYGAGDGLAIPAATVLSELHRLVPSS